MEYAVFGVVAVAAFLFFGARWAALKNVDPINRAMAATLRLCAEGSMSEDDLVEYIKLVFTDNNISLGRQSVARRLIFATTVIDHQMVSKDVKKRALEIAMNLPNRF